MSIDAIEDVVQRIKKLTVEERVELERRVRPILSSGFQQAVTALQESMEKSGITDEDIDRAIVKQRYGK